MTSITDETSRDGDVVGRVAAPSAKTKPAGRVVQPPPPQAANALYNKGYELKRQHRFEEAEKAFRGALRMAPDNLQLKLELALCLLTFGKYAEGWQRYEVRHNPNRSLDAAIPDLPIPFWGGESLAGKSLFISTEQGMGDEIQVFRFLPLIRELGASYITLMCKEALVHLFSHAGLADAVVPFEPGLKLPRHDYWTFPFEIPRYCGIDTPRQITAKIPYISAPPERIDHWRSRIPEQGIRIGLMWKGNPGHGNDHHRSVPSIGELAPLWRATENAEVNFISLQKESAEDEARNPPPDQPLIHLGSDIRDMSDSAAIIHQLDLLITVDSAPAHLAGALGKSCWLMLSYVGTDWRWGQVSDTTPWYPGVLRLFRQSRMGDWQSLIARIASELAEYCAQDDKADDAASLTGGKCNASNSDNPMHKLLAVTQSNTPVEARQINGNKLDDKDNKTQLGAMSNKASTLEEAGNYEEARLIYQELATLAPDDPQIWCNYGKLLRYIGDYAEAEIAYRKAVELEPDNPSNHMNLGMLLIAMGHIEEGFKEYEARYHPKRKKRIVTPDYLPFPQWNGQPLGGKKILAWPEQGYGDQVMFSRYLPLLKKMGADKVSVACSQPLMRLYRSLKGVDQLLPIKDGDELTLEAQDYWVMIASLPFHCASYAEDRYCKTPYLYPDQQLTRQWNKRLPNNFRVGLAWKGSPRYEHDDYRSLEDLSVLAPLWEVEGVSFISLHTEGVGAQQAAAANDSQPIIDLANGISDFADTAAIIDLLDLVICIDSSITHLAGALGKNCWVMLPSWATDWRWGHGSETTVWYSDCMRLYRQRLGEPWSTVVERIKTQLAIRVRDVIKNPDTVATVATADKKDDESRGNGDINSPQVARSAKRINSAAAQEQREKTLQLYNSGRFQQAADNQLRLINEFDEPDEKRSDDFSLLGNIFYVMDKKGAMLDAMREHARLKEDDPIAQENFIIALRIAGELKEARERYYNLRSTGYVSSNLLDSAANLFSKLGSHEESIQCGRESLLIKDREFCAQFKGDPLNPPPRQPFDPKAVKRNIIAYSLWGNKPCYLIAAAENARAVRHVYPSWTCRFYCDDSVPADLIKLLGKEGAQVVNMPPNKLFEGLMWRFLVANDPQVDFFLIRDADSVINVKERVAVDEWLASDKHFHTIRDYYSHSEVILAGLWGGAGNVLPDMREMIKDYNTNLLVNRTIDQWLLRARIWPLIREHTLTHDSLFHVLGSRPFPPYGYLPPGRHVGQSLIDK